jgi:hypothetical protein
MEMNKENQRLERAAGFALTMIDGTGYVSVWKIDRI